MLYRPQSSNSGAESASNHEPASPSSSSISSDDLGVTNPAVTSVTTSDRLPTTAAATAEEIDSSTAVIDSIPWGSSGIATAKGRSVPTGGGGGGGGATGGSTGGGGGATGGSTGGGGGGNGSSDRPLDNNGGEDGDHVSTSPWWVKWLLVGSLVGAINLRDHIQRIPGECRKPMPLGTHLHAHSCSIICRQELLLCFDRTAQLHTLHTAQCIGKECATNPGSYSFAIGCNVYRTAVGRN